MQKEQIISQVNQIFVDVLDNENIAITEQTSAGDIDEWDSLTHIQLVVAIEKHFKLKFTSNEIREWKNVGEMVQNIARRLT